jgi:hypothetical protein
MFLLLFENPKLIMLSCLVSTMIVLSHFGGKSGQAGRQARQGGVRKSEIRK